MDRKQNQTEARERTASTARKCGRQECESTRRKQDRWWVVGGQPRCVEERSQVGSATLVNEQ